jgi:hypothetical protein
MLAIASAMRLAELSQRELVLNWVPETACGCQFEDIFTNQFRKPTSEELTTSIAAMDVIHSFTPKRERGIPSYHPVPLLRVTSYSAFHDISEWSERLSSDSETESLRHLSIYVEKFTPVEAIAATVDAVTRTMPYIAVGVHARRGDHVVAKLRSTDELFVDRMRKKLFEDSSTIFFLATDSTETEQRLVDVFGERIYRYAYKSLSRTSRLGLQAAAADLYSLVECSEVIGSYGSSFSLVASLIGGIDLEWVQ